MYINHFLKAWPPRASIQFLVSCMVSTKSKLPMFYFTARGIQTQLFAIAIKHMFLKFRSIHGKTSVLESVFNKVTELQAGNFIKNRRQYRCFSVNIAKCLRTAFLLSTFSGWFYRCSIKKPVPKNFAKFTKTYHHRSPFYSRCSPRTCNFIKTEDVLLWILWNFSEKYYEEQRLLLDDAWCCGK